MKMPATDDTVLKLTATASLVPSLYFGGSFYWLRMSKRANTKPTDLFAYQEILGSLIKL